uniref:Protein archease n=1 Tax=Oncorhynchus kisutch TaxID=8019 RepID=A0A8C7GT50_ONCKI
MSLLFQIVYLYISDDRKTKYIFVMTWNLFHFLDDWLFKLSADIFFIPKVRAFNIIMIIFLCCCRWGEEFSLVKHPQGTEVKAITYSAMPVHDIDKPEIFAIIDI